MKVATKNRRRLEALVEAATGKNGGLNKETLERELDGVIKDMERVGRKLDELIAKARA